MFTFGAKSIFCWLKLYLGIFGEGYLILSVYLHCSIGYFKIEVLFSGSETISNLQCNMRVMRGVHIVLV